MFQIKLARCPYIQKINRRQYCTKYTWRNRPTDLISKYKSIMFHHVQNEWMFIPHPAICLLCNPMNALFKPRYAEQRAHTRLAQRVHLLTRAGPRRVALHQSECKHKTTKGYCHQWPTQTRIADLDQEPFSFKGKIFYFDNVNQHPELCATCPTFVPVKRPKSTISDLIGPRLI